MEEHYALTRKRENFYLFLEITVTRSVKNKLFRTKKFSWK